MAADAADLLAHLANAPRMLATQAGAAAALGVEPGDLEALVDGLESRGLVDRWPACPAGPAVTLSPLAAWQLGVAPPDEADVVLADRAFPDRAPDGMPANGAAAKGPLPARLPADPRADDPAEQVARGERLRRLALAPPASGDWAGALPEPELLLGQGRTWPMPGQSTAAAGGRPPRPCPACAGWPYTPGAVVTYCLVCDRYTLDHRIPERLRRASRGRTAYRAGRLRGGTGPAAAGGIARAGKRA